MKLKIYHPEEEKPEPEQEVCLRLEPYLSDSVVLVACDERGNKLPDGNLLRISKKGIYRSRNISTAIGFPLDLKSRLEVLDD